MCTHRNLHPARVDINATVCLDCGNQVHVGTFQYANGIGPEEQAGAMWLRCQEQEFVAIPRRSRWSRRRRRRSTSRRPRPPTSTSSGTGR